MNKIQVNEEELADDDCQQIFPQRLMSVLGEEQNHDAICWLPHGRAFIIRNRDAFAERVMPKFFPRKSKYSSFARKLNRWNFARVASGPEIGAYYNEFFLRDKPHLAAQMFCKNARSKVAMASSDPCPTAVFAALQSTSTKPKEVFNATSLAPLQHQNDIGQNVSQGVMRRSIVNTGVASVDPAMSFLLEQQLALGRRHITSQLRMRGVPSQNLATSLAIEIQRQKQQQERLLQMQQMIAMNKLNSQQKRKNNFRASAA